MKNLDLAHTLVITQQTILCALGGLLGLAVALLLVTAFANRWRSLVAVVLILGLIGGGVAYGVHYAHDALDTRGIQPTNRARLIPAVAETYGLRITTAQADQLLTGTSDYVPASNRTMKFGTVTLRVHNRPFPDETHAVTLVSQRGVWRLVVLSDGTYSEVQHRA